MDIDFKKAELGDLNYYLLKNMRDVFLEEESEIKEIILFLFLSILFLFVLML